jgi:hypothetical protein
MPDGRRIMSMKKAVGYTMIGIAAGALQGVLIFMGIQGGPGAWAPIYMEAGLAYIGTAMWCVL